MKQLCLLLCLIFLSSCAVNTARMDAKIKEGWSHQFSGQRYWTGEGHAEDGRRAGKFGGINLQWDVMHGSRLKEDHSGFEWGFKVPISFIYSSLEAYYAFPSPRGFYYGVGVEANMLFPAVYLSITKDLFSNYALTLTTRGGAGIGRWETKPGVNSQLTFFRRGERTSLGAFVNVLKIFSTKGLLVETPNDEGVYPAGTIEKTNRFADEFLSAGLFVRF